MNGAVSPLDIRYAQAIGSVGKTRQRRSWLVYALIFSVGAALWVLGPSVGWRAFGLGLWAPGFGFLASGGWSLALLPITILLFAVTVFFWFAAGAIIFPILVWLGSAVFAAALTGADVWPVAPYAGAALLIAAFGFQAMRLRRKAAIQRTAAARKFEAMDQLVVAAKACAAPRPEGGRELTPEMLAASRYMLDRALQPVPEFNGFDRIDIFQTASVRYQINFMGYALSILQAQYLPSFHGYLSRAQRQLIEKYLLPQVWKYWVFESIWGNLNFVNWDPAAKDNIMLTGYFGAQVNLYMRGTGDTCYGEPGSLTFRLNDRKVFAHDVHSINRSLVDNFSRSAYCLYPCEPNWIYPACNFRGMLSLVSYDRLFGTHHAGDIEESFWRSVDTEFTDHAGSIVALRSSLTGIPFPFPGSDLSFAPMANVFAQERAMKLWAPIAMGLRRAMIAQNGSVLLALPNNGIDFGNYRRGVRTMAACSIMQIAREFGDSELAEAARHTLRTYGGESLENGVLSFATGSNMANIYAMQGIFARRDDIRTTWLDGPDQACLRGPLLDNDTYPEMLVAAAHGDGADLRLVLYPGTKEGPQELTFAQLRPGGRYELTGCDGFLIADMHGSASAFVLICGRTEIHLRPAS